jgi:hypothetical protein
MEGHSSGLFEGGLFGALGYPGLTLAVSIFGDALPFWDAREDARECPRDMSATFWLVIKPADYETELRDS